MRYLLFLLLGVALFSSCETEKEHPLNGKWSLISIDLPGGNVEEAQDSLDLHISFNTAQGNTFTENFLNESPVKGEWTSTDTSVVITFVPPNVINTVDSVFINNDSLGGASIVLQNGNTKLGEVVDGTVVPEKFEVDLGILSISDSELRLVHQGIVFNLKKEIITAPPFSVKSFFRGLIGMAFLIGTCWFFSADRKNIDWNLVVKGLLLQGIIAVLVLKVSFVGVAFDWVSDKFVALIGYTDFGFEFLFKNLGTGVVESPMFNFAFKILPTIVFFSALVSLFYYWGILQKVVYAFAWVMKKFMRLSGAESLAAAGNVFLGQTEAPLLVKPYLLGMTKSEIMCLMTGGMATIAGGVLAAYVGFLGGEDPIQQAFFAKHLLTASIISAPAAIIAAKILIPESEKINEDLSVPKDKIGANALEAITNGTTDGLKLAINVGAMLLVFIALMALANGVLGWVGDVTGANEAIASGGVYDKLSFEYILGNIGRPIVWLMGVDWADSIYVGELLGTKTILNEFVAYPRLGEMKEAGMLSEKSVIMSTYMLCGFANFASIGIQIGGIGSLIPTRKGLLSKLGVRALIGGTVACLMTAVIVGMML